MIFHFHREPPFVRVERRPACHSPGLEDPIQFEPKIVVKSRLAWYWERSACPVTVAPRCLFNPQTTRGVGIGSI